MKVRVVDKTTGHHISRAGAHSRPHVRHGFREAPRKHILTHGDVVTWGGPARLTFHSIDTVAHSEHALTGPYRYNLTFRCAREVGVLRNDESAGA